MYTKPGCFGCRKTIEKFRAAGIEPQVVDVSIVPAALEYITEDLGYCQAPVVVIDEHTLVRPGPGEHSIRHRPPRPHGSSPMTDHRKGQGR